MVKISRIGPGGTRLTSQSGVAPRNVASEMQVGRAVSGLGKTMQGVAQKFENLYNKQKETEGQIATYRGITDIAATAKTDVDIDNPAVQAEYAGQIANLRGKVLADMPEGIAKTNVSNAFDLEAIKLQANIKAYGRTALMHKTIASKQEKFRIMRSEYREADPALRPEMFNAVTREIDGLVADGFMLPEKADELKEGAREEWNTQAALKDAEVYGVDYVLKHLSDYDVDDKEKLVQEVKRVGLLRKKQFDLNQAIIHQAGQKAVFDVLANPDIDYMTKLDTIEQSEKEGKIDKNTSVIAKQNLFSANKIDAKTHTAKMVDVLRVIEDLDEGVSVIKDKNNAEEVLKRIKEAKNLVVKLNSTGQLTTDDKDKLLAEIETKISDEQRKTAQELRASGSVFHWGYNDADKYFKDNLANDAYRNEAMRDFFYAIEGRKVSGKERKEIAEEIQIQIKNKVLGKTTEELPIGTKMNGYKFKGGDRYDKKNWEKI